MKVSAARQFAAARPTAARGGVTAAPGFSLPDVGAAAHSAAAARVGSPLTVSSIDALLVLQGVSGAPERRTRAIHRARMILDVLEELKLGVLEGAAPAPMLGRLADAVRQQRANTGDARLDGVLDEIETRAAVELAKLQQNAA